MRRGGTSIGTVVAAVAVLVIGWLGVRNLTERQVQAHSDAGVVDAQSAEASPATPLLVPQIPAAIASSATKAKTPLARLDVTVRVDGLDLALDGAPTCREQGKRLVGRASGGAAGSFDETALATCVTIARTGRPDARFVAMVGRAGPAVPRTFVDALVAALGRAGITDVVVTP